MRLALSSLVCAVWLGVLVPALAIARSGEPCVRAATAGEGVLAASSTAPPFTLERSAASMGVFVADEPGSSRLELQGYDALPLGHRAWTLGATVEACPPETVRRPARAAGLFRERSRGPPRLA